MSTSNVPFGESPWQYFVVRPLRNAWEHVKDWFGEQRIRLIGGWYCEYCGKIHGRRIYKFELFFNKDGASASDTGTMSDNFEVSDRFVCSLGCDALRAGTWVPEKPTLTWCMNKCAQSLGHTLEGL